MIFCARAMCGRGKPSLGLMARLGKSIAKQSEGRAGEKYLPMGGRVRKLRAVGDLYKLRISPFHLCIGVRVNIYRRVDYASRDHPT